MRTFLILAALGWVISLPWATLFAYFVLIVIVIALLWLISVSIEHRAVSPWRGGNTIDHNYVAALETMVAEAEAEVETLRREIDRLRSAAGAEPDPITAHYHKVGLIPAAPDWLVLAARRAYRTALHPDRHPAHRKKEVERRFQLAESLFDEIVALRS